MRVPSTPRLGPLAVVASNLVPLLGVYALGWSTTALLGVLVLELAAVLFWSAVKIPFAEKRPNNAIGEDERLLGPLEEKRGATALPGPLPPVYLRNAPTLLVAVFLLAPFELFVALMVFGAANPTVTDGAVGVILLGGVAVFLSRGVETYTGYFRGGGYRDHSPRSVLLVPLKHLFGVGTLLFIAGSFQGASGEDAVLGLVLTGKLVYDLRTLQIERVRDERGFFYRLYGSEKTEIPPVPVEEPDGSPNCRVRAPRRVAVTDALYRGVSYTFTSVVLFCYVGATLALAFAPLPFVAVPLVAAIGFACVRTTTRYVRHGTLEYRCFDDVLIVYDTLLAEPQARLEWDAITDVAVSTDAVDRVFGTQSLEFDTDEADDATPVRPTVPDPDEIEGGDANANHPLTLYHVEDSEAVADAVGAS